MIVKNYVHDKKFDHKLLEKEVRKVVRTLNKVIDINTYITEKGKRGGLEQRAIGIGVQGLADVFFLMDYEFTSTEAKQLNKDIFETIYFAAVSESCKLCEDKVHEPYKFFKGSPMSKGIFQFDMWGENQENFSGRWDWATLKEKVMKHGVCNSLTTTQMPVACQTKSAKIRTEGAVRSFEEILHDQGLDVSEIEKDPVGKQWFDFRLPIQVDTMNGPKESSRVFYSGHDTTFSIEMEDGSIFECSENHQFLVNTPNGEEWKKAKDLSDGDDIVNIF